jgi:uncharacterized membrane protein SirB2
MKEPKVNTPLALLSDVCLLFVVPFALFFGFTWLTVRFESQIRDLIPRDYASYVGQGFHIMFMGIGMIPLLKRIKSALSQENTPARTRRIMILVVVSTIYFFGYGVVLTVLDLIYGMSLTGRWL